MFSCKELAVLSKIVRFNSTASAVFVNRNPRNLERMRIARKPQGYHLEKPGRNFWHKLELTVTNRLVKAEVVHFVNGPVIVAKTSEKALRNQLYSVTDICAYKNLGKVFAQRCLESGITEIYCNIEVTEGGKVQKFLEELTNGGVRLEESEVYKKPQPWDLHRPEKPWEVVEE